MIDCEFVQVVAGVEHRALFELPAVPRVGDFFDAVLCDGEGEITRVSPIAGTVTGVRWRLGVAPLVTLITRATS